MIIIKKLSETGFQSMNNRWYNVDKFKVKKEDVDKLQVGTKLDDIETNKKGYIISFTIVGSEDSIEENLVKPPKFDKISHPQSIKASDTDRKILKGQCLNLAFKDIDIFDEHARISGIKYAQKLFVELEDANFYEW